MRDPVKRIEPLVLAGSLLVLVALIALRATAAGKRLAAATTHWLGEADRPDGGLIWPASGLVARAYLPFVALTLVALAVALTRHSLRRRALAGAFVLVVSGVGAQVLGRLLVPVLGQESATLPSGHAALVLGACVAWIWIAPARHRLAVLCAAGVVATAGSLGIVVAQWHRPGDVLASLALVTAVTAVARSFARTDTIAPAVSEAEGNRALTFRGGFGYSPSTEALVAVLCGAAGCVVLYQGWGSALVGENVASLAGGFAVRWGLALAAGLLVWFAARVDESPVSRLH